ncbi:l-ascorbate oxidase-like protein [Hordeum vulgare]|nr:l-ascorbate oxidase-like protein [Hordeum vulgare]
MRVRAEYPKPHSMLLGHGWKAFAQAHGLEDEYVLRFKLMEARMLVVKFYGRSDVCLRCCEQRSSGVECPSSSDNDERDSSGSGALGRSRSRGVKSKYDSLSSD